MSWPRLPEQVTWNRDGLWIQTRNFGEKCIPAYPYLQHPLENMESEQLSA
jgi:hypothetical protein